MNIRFFLITPGTIVLIAIDLILYDKCDDEQWHGATECYIFLRHSESIQFIQGIFAIWLFVAAAAAAEPKCTFSIAQFVL